MLHLLRLSLIRRPIVCRYLRFFLQRLERIPIRTTDFDNPADKAMHDKMVALVDRMLDLHRQLSGLTAVQRGVVEQRIEAVDREIDALLENSGSGVG